MGIVSFNEAVNSPEGSENEKGQRSYTRTFICVTDTVWDGAAQVLNHYACPQLFDHYTFAGPTGIEFDLTSRVRERKATRQDDNQPVWTVTIQYKTSDEDDEEENPLLEPVEARLTAESFKKVAEGTANIDSLSGATFQHPIANSAGEPFRNPTPEVDDGYNVLTLVKNHAIDFDLLQAADDYRFKVNNDQFFGRPAGAWRCESPTGELKRKERQNQPPIDYLRVTWTFKCKGDWRLELLDIGSYYYGEGANANKKFAFRDNTGAPYLGLLDGTGHKLLDGANPVWLPKKKIYKEAAFAALNLPQSFDECKKFLR